MELKLQVKLLRFLQTGMIQRVGSSRPEAVNVRVICATNRDPAAEVAAGRFREDLFYRLSVLPIELPPLRQRGDDIGLLAQSFLDRFAAEENKHFDALSDDLIAQMKRHPWPGNVRELQNAMRRAVVMSAGPKLSLPATLGGENARAAPVSAQTHDLAQTAADSDTPVPPSGFDGMTLEEIERWAIERAIERCGGSIPAAARVLDTSPSTLYRKRERWADRTDTATTS